MLRPHAIIFAFITSEGVPMWRWYFIKGNKLITELRNHA